MTVYRRKYFISTERNRIGLHIALTKTISLNNSW